MSEVPLCLLKSGSFWSVGCFKLPPWADTRTCSAERPWFLGKGTQRVGRPPPLLGLRCLGQSRENRPSGVSDTNTAAMPVIAELLLQWPVLSDLGFDA